MDVDRWYRRAKKKADALFVQGIALAIAAMVLGAMLANIGKGAGDPWWTSAEIVVNCVLGRPISRPGLT